MPGLRFLLGNGVTPKVADDACQPLAAVPAPPAR